MTTKELASFIGKSCKVKVGVGTTVWHIPAVVHDVRIRYGIRDYFVELDLGQGYEPTKCSDNVAWVSESNVLM